MSNLLDNLVSQMGGRTLQIFAMVVFVVELLACLVAALATLALDPTYSLLLHIAGPLVIFFLNAPIYVLGGMGIRRKEAVLVTHQENT